MKVLVIGSGGREHALVWKLRESPRVEKIWCAPGNGGIAAEAECIAIDAGDVAGLVALAERLRPDLTVVGPELPLVDGLADAFRARNLPVVGPSQIAAQLEGSKNFSKQFLLRHNIPTAAIVGVFENAEEAAAALKDVRYPLVMKADGLCAGKGVLLAADESEALAFIDSTLRRHELGPAGRKLLVEETLQGEEISFIIVVDGERYAPLGCLLDRRPPSCATSRNDYQNHRRAYSQRSVCGWHPLPRVSFYRPDDHFRGPKSPRVQLPFGRSRNPSHFRPA